MSQSNDNQNISNSYVVINNYTSLHNTPDNYKKKIEKFKGLIYSQNSIHKIRSNIKLNFISKIRHNVKPTIKSLDNSYINLPQNFTPEKYLQKNNSLEKIKNSNLPVKIKNTTKNVLAPGAFCTIDDCSRSTSKKKFRINKMNYALSQRFENNFKETNGNFKKEGKVSNTVVDDIRAGKFYQQKKNNFERVKKLGEMKVVNNQRYKLEENDPKKQKIFNKKIQNYIKNTSSQQNSLDKNTNYQKEYKKKKMIMKKVFNTNKTRSSLNNYSANVSFINNKAESAMTLGRAKLLHQEELSLASLATSRNLGASQKW